VAVQSLVREAMPHDSVPLVAANKTGCKVATSKVSWIHSVASRRWCQIRLHHSLNRTLCHPEFLAPKYRFGHPRPNCCSYRNAPDTGNEGWESPPPSVQDIWWVGLIKVSGGSSTRH